MTIGIGMPRNSRRSERMVVSVNVNEIEDQASRRLPPKVAARLATNAPMSSDTNNHNAL
jgi:hypothetical protein